MSRTDHQFYITPNIIDREALPSDADQIGRDVQSFHGSSTPR